MLRGGESSATPDLPVSVAPEDLAYKVPRNSQSQLHKKWAWPVYPKILKETYVYRVDKLKIE